MNRKKQTLKNITDLGNKSSVDVKLNREALLLQLMFEYGINFKQRIINLTGEVDEYMYNLFEIAMTELESQSKKSITVKINSPGGSTYNAMAIIGRMKESKCRVVTKGYGQVMSAATLILASGDKRMMSSEGFLMWHEASYGLEVGRHSQNKATVEQVAKEEEFWAKRMSERSNQTPDFWKINGTGIDAYFSADDLLDLDVIDEIF